MVSKYNIYSSITIYSLSAPARFSGFNIDLMEELANRLNITSFEYVEVTAGSAKSKTNDSFTGIVGGLISRVRKVTFTPR